MQETSRQFWLALNSAQSPEDTAAQVYTLLSQAAQRQAEEQDRKVPHARHSELATLHQWA